MNIKNKVVATVAACVLALGVGTVAAPAAHANWNSNLFVSPGSYSVTWAHDNGWWSTLWSGNARYGGVQAIVVKAGQCVKYSNANTGGYWRYSCNYYAPGSWHYIMLPSGATYVSRYL